MNDAIRVLRHPGLILLAASVSLSVWAAEGVFFGKTVSYLGAGDSRPCAFFTLDGVPEAVAAVPGAPWFVLAKDHPKYKESFALLLSAKLTGRQVNVTTSGNVYAACGHAEVISIGLN